MFLLLLAGVAMPEAVAAQEGDFAFQIRGGRFLPVGRLRAADQGWEGESRGGVGFGMGFTLPLGGPFSTYLGFGQYRFSCQEGVCPKGEEWESTGFDVAVRYVMRKRNPIRPWLQLGLHTHRIQSQIYEPDALREVHSRGGGGYEVGGGLLIQVGERTSLSPGLRYGHAETPYQDHPRLKLRYVLLDLGLVMGF